MPKDKFITRLEAQTPAVPAMPLAHTTNAGDLSSILDENVVKPLHEFNGQPTLYFFYGVNFYRQTASFKDALSRPVGFLLKNDILNEAKSVFPFDTGAHAAKLYGDYLEKNVLEYEVPMASNDTPAKMVTTLFETNSNYISGKPRDLKSAKTKTEHKLIGFVRDATTKIQPEKFDDRCFAIEIQFTKEQRFKENVELLILPRNSYEESLKGLLEDNLSGMPIKYYDDMPVSGPSADSILIRAQATAYLRRKGLLR